MGCFSSKSSSELKNNQTNAQPTTQFSSIQPPNTQSIPEAIIHTTHESVLIRVESKLTPDQIKSTDFTPANTQK